MRSQAQRSTTSLVPSSWICLRCQLARQKAMRATYSTSSRGHVASDWKRRRMRFSGETFLLKKNFTAIATRQSLATKSNSTRTSRLPDYPARTRFAPSPTGFMHIGGLRTALFSYLLAKRTGGQFLLRIEDTDQKRFVADAEQRIFDDLSWAGLQWDEGPEVGGPYGPYRQSERSNLYQEHAKILLDAGAAYRCFCTSQTTGKGTATFVTSGCYQYCSSLSHSESLVKAGEKRERFTVRLVSPPNVHRRVYPDLIYGKIKRLKRSPSASLVQSDSAEDGAGGGLDVADTILIKSDGRPTYHFANVVDDHLMKITHVIRGTEWMASTPLHYDLYAAFGWEPPQFAHVGLLLDKDKAKLSKRNNDLQLDVLSLRGDEGVLPETLVNFLLLLGWSNPRESDVLQLREMIEIFDLKFTTGNTICDTKKLWFLQKHHVHSRCLEYRRHGHETMLSEIVGRIQQSVLTCYSNSLVGRAKEAYEHGNLYDFCREILLLDDKSFQTPSQWVSRNDYFFTFDDSKVLETRPHATIGSHAIDSGLSHAIEKALLDWVGSKSQASSEFAATTEGSVLSANTAERDLSAPPLSAESESDAIHAALHRHIWDLAALTVVGQVSDAKSFSITDTASGCSPSQVGHTKVCLDEQHTQQVLAVYKICNKAAMKWLRERLCYGKPGPGMGIVIAALGWDECARRLGFSTQEEAAKV